MSPITDAAQALAGLLRTAEDAGLPLPFDAAVTDYAPHRHAATGSSHGGGIALMVHTLDELTAWATWLDEPIDDSTVSEGRIHCRVDGMAGPVPVRVTALVAPELLVAS